MGRWPLWIVLLLAVVTSPVDEARAEIAERQEGVGQNLGATDVSKLPRAQAVAEPRQRKPFKLLPRPRDPQASPQKNTGLRPPRR
jgi:hypothetical protein